MMKMKKPIFLNPQKTKCPTCILCGHNECCHEYHGEIIECQHVECKCSEFIEYKEKDNET